MTWCIGYLGLRVCNYFWELVFWHTRWHMCTAYIHLGRGSLGNGCFLGWFFWSTKWHRLGNFTHCILDQDCFVRGSCFSDCALSWAAHLAVRPDLYMYSSSYHTETIMRRIIWETGDMWLLFQEYTHDSVTLITAASAWDENEWYKSKQRITANYILSPYKAYETQHCICKISICELLG